MQVGDEKHFPAAPEIKAEKGLQQLFPLDLGAQDRR